MTTFRTSDKQGKFSIDLDFQTLLAKVHLFG